MDVDQEGTSSKIEELPDDYFTFGNVLSSAQSAVVVDSASDDADEDGQMEDVQPVYTTKTVRGNVVIEELDDEAQSPFGPAASQSLDSFCQEFVLNYYRYLNSIWRLGMLKNLSAAWKLRSGFLDNALCTLAGTRLSTADVIVEALVQGLVLNDFLVRLKPTGESSSYYNGVIHLLVTGKVEYVPARPKVDDLQEQSDDMVDTSMTGPNLFGQTFILMRSPTDGRWLIAQTILQLLYDAPT